MVFYLILKFLWYKCDLARISLRNKKVWLIRKLMHFILRAQFLVFIVVFIAGPEDWQLIHSLIWGNWNYSSGVNNGCQELLSSRQVFIWRPGAKFQHVIASACKEAYHNCNVYLQSGFTPGVMRKHFLHLSLLISFISQISWLLRDVLLKSFHLDAHGTLRESSFESTINHSGLLFCSKKLSITFSS